MYEAMRTDPDRFAGFATLPTPDPRAAADELDSETDRQAIFGGNARKLPKL